MEEIVVGEHAKLVSEMPGANPDSLPLQPIEGSLEALTQIQQVWAKGEAGEGVRVSVFGASHTGADLWTGQIRRILQDRWGDGGHGFVLPAALYKGYRGNDVNLCRTEGWLSDWQGKANGHEDGWLGFAGMSVSSGNPDDFGWVETTHTNPHGRKVEWVDVYYLGSPDGGTLDVSVDGQPAVSIATAATKQGLRRLRIELTDGSHRIAFSPQGDGVVRLFGVSMERGNSGTLVDAMGVRGREARTWLDWNREQWVSGIRAIDPDLVVLAYGTNEAADQSYDMDSYRQDLRKVMGMLREGIGDQTACLLAGPSDRGMKLGGARYAIWDRTAPVAQVQREVAKEFGCGFWDWQEATGGPGSMVAWHFQKEPLAAGDLIHFTRAGYYRLGSALVDAIDAIPESSGGPASAEPPDVAQPD